MAAQSSRLSLPRGQWLPIVAVAAVAVVGLGWLAVARLNPLAGAASPTSIARVGAPAPDIALPLVDGGQFRLAQQAGKVVLLNFWATWCVPCRSEMPELGQLAEDLRAEPFALFTVDLQEDAPAVEGFRREVGVRLPVALDEEGSATRSYGVRALPATFLVDQRGVLRQQRLGPLASGGPETAWSRAWIAQHVRSLLGS